MSIYKKNKRRKLLTNLFFKWTTFVELEKYEWFWGDLNLAKKQFGLLGLRLKSWIFFPERYES